MNESRYGFLRALLITFGLIQLIGIVWYSNTLSLTTLLCGIVACIAAFFLGIADFQNKTSIFKQRDFAAIAIAVIITAIIRIFHDTNMFSDLWGALPHLLTLALFGYTLKAIFNSNNNAQNQKDSKQTQLTE
jgi:hypothetical protein